MMARGNVLGLGSLTEDEVSVLRSVWDGNTHKEAAFLLNLSLQQVQHHLRYAREKVGARCTMDLLRRCLTAGLLEM